MISKRAENLLSQPQFTLNKLKQSSFNWKIEYSGGHSQFQTDKILTLQYSHSTEDDLENILLESICRLAQGKTLQFLFTMSYREIESFLRDENHTPAFTGDIEAHAVSVFQQVKKSLLVQILKTKLSLSDSKSRADWSTLSLVAKNRDVKNFLTVLGNLFLPAKSLELVLAEDDTVTVKKNEFPLDLEIVEALLGLQFFGNQGTSPLKVVGTL